MVVSGASQSPAPTSLQRLPFSSDFYSLATPISSASHSPATRILQRLPFCSAYHSPAPAILQRLHSPATAILQRLPSSSAYHSPATAILQRPYFSSPCASLKTLECLHSEPDLAPNAASPPLSTISPGNYWHLQHPQAIKRWLLKHQLSVANWEYQREQAFHPSRSGPRRKIIAHIIIDMNKDKY
jgi:hypothetical protein